MSERTIQRDLHNKIGGQIQSLLEREMRIMQHVLPPPVIAEVMLILAAAISCSLVSGVLQMSQDDADPAEGFDTFAGLLTGLIASRKAEVLDGVALIRAGKADEAIAKYGSAGL